jgi:hypothetical protein
MRQKIAASFAIVLALAMILSTNPVMTMPSKIFASSDGDGGSGDKGGSGDEGSSSEQPEEESEPEVTEEETEPETVEEEPITEPEPTLVNCPGGSQAATSAECPIATATTEVVDCPDGTKAATAEECGTGTGMTPENILWGDYFYLDSCKTNPNDPICKTPTTTPGATTEEVPPASLLLPYFEYDVEVPANKDGTCPAGSHIVGSGGKTGAPSGSKCVSDNPATTPMDQTFFCKFNPTDTLCTKTPTTEPTEVEVLKNPDGTCPPGSNAVGTGSTTGTGSSKCVIDDDPTTPVPTGQTAPTTLGTPTAPITQTGQTGPATPNRNTDGSSSTFSTTIVNPAAPTTTTTVSPEVSNCRLDGNANGIQQQFDTAKFSACGLYPTGQTAYSEGFTAGCIEAGNTQQMCTAFIQLNTGAQSTTTTQTQPPTQAIPPAG